MEAINWVVGWTALDTVEVDGIVLDIEEVKSWLLESNCEAIGRSELDVDTRATDDIVF